jgi:hypothetical protein
MVLKGLKQSLRRLVGLVSAGGTMDHPANGGMVRESHEDERNDES